MRSCYVILSCSVAAGVVLSAATIASAQTPPWAVGTWKGKMESYSGDPNGPDRVLVVEPSGGCRWDYASKAANPGRAKSCSVTADSVELLTGGSSTVKLKLTGGTLRGTFVTAGSGKTYFVTLSK